MPADGRPSAAVLLRCAWCWLRGAVVTPQDIAAAYDRASPTYHLWEELMGGQLDGLLGPGELAGARACDLACGTGAMSQRLLAAGAAAVDAVDLSPGMLERCRAHAGPGITPVLAEAGAFLAASGAPYDAIACTWAWPYLPPSMPRLLARRLRPGGLLVVVCNRRDTLPGLTAAVYDAMAAAPGEIRRILTIGSRLPPSADTLARRLTPHGFRVRLAEHGEELHREPDGEALLAWLEETGAGAGLESLFADPVRGRARLAAALGRRCRDGYGVAIAHRFLRLVAVRT